MALQVILLSFRLDHGSLAYVKSFLSHSIIDCVNLFLDFCQQHYFILIVAKGLYLRSLWTMSLTKCWPLLHFLTIQTSMLLRLLSGSSGLQRTMRLVTAQSSTHCFFITLCPNQTTNRVAPENWSAPCSMPYLTFIIAFWQYHWALSWVSITFTTYNNNFLYAAFD